MRSNEAVLLLPRRWSCHVKQPQESCISTESEDGAKSKTHRNSFVSSEAPGNCRFRCHQRRREGKGKGRAHFPPRFKNLDSVVWRPAPRARARWQPPKARARIACPPNHLPRLRSGDRQRSKLALGERGPTGVACCMAPPSVTTATAPEARERSATAAAAHIGACGGRANIGRAGGQVRYTWLQVITTKPH